MSDLLDRKCTIEKCWICQKNCLWYPHNDKRDFILAKPDLIKWRLHNCPEPSVSAKALMLDILKRYSTGEIVESGEQKEKEEMVSIKTVDIEKEKEAAREEGYKAGLEEAWEIARRLGCNFHDGGYSVDDVDSIFGSRWYDVLLEMSIHEVKEKIAAYEAEEAKPKLGDVVEFRYISTGNSSKGILIGKKSDRYHILMKDYQVPQIIFKNDVTIEKTGKHFDIQSMLDEIG